MGQKMNKKTNEVIVNREGERFGLRVGADVRPRTPPVLRPFTEILQEPTKKTVPNGL